MRVAICGCGYVGLELGRHLLAAGHDPIGVRRSTAGLNRVREAGIEPVAADLTDPEAVARIPDVDAVAFLATPDARTAEAAADLHLDGLQCVIDGFAARDDPPERLVYASTTGVYGDHGGRWVDETTRIRPPTAKLRVIARAEGLARQYAGTQGIDGGVVRFAGLYGPDRYRLDRYLASPVTEGVLNLLHREDAARATRAMLLGTVDTDLLLAVDDEPVERPALARWLAAQCGVEPPSTQSLPDRLDAMDDPGRRVRVRANKRCSNARLREAGIDLAYPTYREGYRGAIASHGGQDS